MVKDKYSNYEISIIKYINTALEQNRGLIADCGGLIANAVQNNGIIHAFGTGHSSAVASELFHRAGGLACVNLLANPALSPFAGRQSGKLERVSGVAEAICTGHDLRDGDIGFVISNSAKNAVPTEVAQILVKKGIKVIGVISLPHANAVKKGITLQDVCNIILDTGIPAGDAIVRQEGENPYGPASTIIGSVLVNAAICSAIEILRDKGFPSVVLRSQNLPEAEEANEILRSRYRSRIRLY